MPPKARIGGSGRPAQRGYMQNVFEQLSSPDNRSVVISVSFFAAGVAFLHSSWGEILLPPA